MAAPLGPPPSRAITWILPSGVTRESVRRSISTSTTEPSGMATGPSGNRRPVVISRNAGVEVSTFIARLPASGSRPDEVGLAGRVRRGHHHADPLSDAHVPQSSRLAD